MFTVDNLTRKLKASPRAVRRLIQRGRLHAVKVGVGYRITAASLETFRNGQEKKVGFMQD